MTLDPGSSKIAMSDWHSRALTRHVLQLLSSRVRPIRPTVGVEHEFFLLGEHGEPASFIEAARFVAAFAKRSQASVDEGNCGRDGLGRVHLARDGGRYTVLKPEHAPHLLEVAFAWYSDLHQLARDVAQVFESLDGAAADAGLHVAHRPDLGISGADPRVQPASARLRALFHSRAELFRHRGEQPDWDAIGFPAVLAATQVHVGGLAWWERPELVTALNQLEPELAVLTGEAATVSRRWRAYAKVFRGMPLVGLAIDEPWSAAGWAEGLLRSPLIGGPEVPWAGRAFRDLTAPPFPNWNSFLAAARDLQAIRPRIFGTLEFRSDPAQPTPSAILSAAALRFAAALCAEDHGPSAMPIADAHAAWWAAIEDCRFPDPAPGRCSAFARTLAERGLGEERYLAPILHRDEATRPAAPPKAVVD
jgi:hypothetical protein